MAGEDVDLATLFFPCSRTLSDFGQASFASKQKMARIGLQFVLKAAQLKVKGQSPFFSVKMLKECTTALTIKAKIRGCCLIQNLNTLHTDTVMQRSTVSNENFRKITQSLAHTYTM